MEPPGDRFGTDPLAMPTSGGAAYALRRPESTPLFHWGEGGGEGVRADPCVAKRPARRSLAIYPGGCPNRMKRRDV